MEGRAGVDPGQFFAITFSILSLLDTTKHSPLSRAMTNIKFGQNENKICYCYCSFVSQKGWETIIVRAYK